MPRFAILEHDFPALHWDFLLEHGETLLTWRLPAPPAIGVRVEAEQLPDHRKIYLDYEGPVSQGRGSVRRWDGGSYEVLAWSDDGIEIKVAGRRLQARCTLRRTDPGGHWSIEWTNPNTTRPFD
ncbi:MAG: ATP-dependent DNA ligase [Planctomycetes bacterium]|nr:ATP-dependent DNA ligase [Planctomycetota bacterium]